MVSVGDKTGSWSLSGNWRFAFLLFIANLIVYLLLVIHGLPSDLGNTIVQVNLALVVGAVLVSIMDHAEGKPS